jgi:hypothetical protein
MDGVDYEDAVRAFGPLDPAGFPYPPAIGTPEERERWDICTKVALTLWEKMAPPGTPRDNEWLMYTVRAYYSSDIPAGSPQDARSVSTACRQHAEG